MTYSKPAATTPAEIARTVADGLVRGRRPRQTPLAPSASSGGRRGGQILRRQRRGTASPAVGPGAAPDLAAVIDWPPLVALVHEPLSPNVYINHSHLDVHPPHPPTGAHRWRRDNGLMGRDMRLLWRDQPWVTLKVAVYLTDVDSADDGALEVVPRSHLDAMSRYPYEERPRRRAHPRTRWHGRRLRRPTLGPKTFGARPQGVPAPPGPPCGRAATIALAVRASQPNGPEAHSPAVVIWDRYRTRNWLGSAAARTSAAPVHRARLRD
jgi:hypothetical protein